MRSHRKPLHPLISDSLHHIGTNRYGDATTEERHVDYQLVDRAVAEEFPDQSTHAPVADAERQARDQSEARGDGRARSQHKLQGGQFRIGDGPLDITEPQKLNDVCHVVADFTALPVCEAAGKNVAGEHRRGDYGAIPLLVPPLKSRAAYALSVRTIDFSAPEIHQ